MRGGWGALVVKQQLLSAFFMFHSHLLFNVMSRIFLALFLLKWQNIFMFLKIVVMDVCIFFIIKPSRDTGIKVLSWFTLSLWGYEKEASARQPQLLVVSQSSCCSSWFSVLLFVCNLVHTNFFSILSCKRKVWKRAKNRNFWQEKEPLVVTLSCLWKNAIMHPCDKSFPNPERKHSSLLLFVVS